MPLRTPETLLRLGTCAVVSAFGTAILLPALAHLSDATIVWWLCYVLAAGVTIGGGERPLAAWPRLLVAAVPASCELIYVAFYVFALGRSLLLSEVGSDNPRFWAIVGLLAFLTWLFAVLFSYSREAIEIIVRYLANNASERQIKNVSRGIAAIVGVVSAITLLFHTIGVP